MAHKPAPDRLNEVIWICCLLFIFCHTAAHARKDGPDTVPEIHTVLPQDAIPAIFDPEFVPAEQADARDNAPMIGLSINGEHHAYSMYLLNGHEIVNDIVGGKPVATTW